MTNEQLAQEVSSKSGSIVVVPKTAYDVDFLDVRRHPALSRKGFLSLFVSDWFLVDESSPAKTAELILDGTYNPDDYFFVAVRT